MVGEPVEQGCGHLGIAKDGAPLAEAQVGGDGHAGALVELAEQVEQQGAARCAERQVAQLVEDDEVKAEQALGEVPGLVGGLRVARQSGWLPYCLTQGCSRQPDDCLTSLLPLHHASAPVAASACTLSPAMAAPNTSVCATSRRQPFKRRCSVRSCPSG